MVTTSHPSESNSTTPESNKRSIHFLRISSGPLHTVMQVGYNRVPDPRFSLLHGSFDKIGEHKDVHFSVLRHVLHGLSVTAGADMEHGPGPDALDHVGPGPPGENSIWGR